MIRKHPDGGKFFWSIRRMTGDKNTLSAARSSRAALSTVSANGCTQRPAQKRSNKPFTAATP